MSSNQMPQIVILPESAEAEKRWALALDLAEAFGSDRSWALIGGLMVQLFAFEFQADARPTVDIDFLGDARRDPRMTKRAAEIVIERGGEMAMPPRTDPSLGYKFEIEGETVEILGPEGLKNPPPTVDGMVTFEAEGGRQALGRAEVVMVTMAGRSPTPMRRPRLLGAILIKARVLAKKRPEKFESDRLDLIRLLSCVEDPRTLADEEKLSKKERGWLTRVEELLAFDDAELTRQLDPESLARARLSFRLLAANASA
jgi:hypothetical protein